MRHGYKASHATRHGSVLYGLQVWQEKKEDIRASSKSSMAKLAEVLAPEVRACAALVVLLLLVRCWPAAGGRLAPLLLACLAACCFLGADWPALVCPSTPWGSRPPRR